MTACPRCGGSAAPGQEFCLDCGLRLPGRARLGPPPANLRRLAIPLAAMAALAAAGAALAIVLTQEPAQPATVTVAIGGTVVRTSPSADSRPRLTEWPAGTNGWTNVLVSVPKIDGRGAAVARAEQARKQGLKKVGVLDSSLFASLHPGYWVVFAGVYRAEAEAASALQRARKVQRTARTQRIAA